MTVPGLAEPETSFSHAGRRSPAVSRKILGFAAAMRSFYIILIAALVGAAAIGVKRLGGLLAHPAVDVIVVLSVLAVSVGLIRFINRLRD